MDVPLWHRPNPKKFGLYSTVAEEVWSPGVNEAVCKPPFFYVSRSSPCTISPNPYCDCGLHAHHSLDLLVESFPHPFTHMRVYGVVRGWGAVRVHPNGWRAQFAEPLALIIRDGTSEHVRDLATLYSLPTLPFNAFPEVLTEFGRPVPEELWPEAEHDA